MHKAWNGFNIYREHRREPKEKMESLVKTKNTLPPDQLIYIYIYHSLYSIISYLKTPIKYDISVLITDISRNKIFHTNLFENVFTISLKPNHYKDVHKRIPTILKRISIM